MKATINILTAAAMCLSIFSIIAGCQLKPVSRTGHANTINAIAFSLDGRVLISGSDDKTIKFWDVAEAKEFKTIQRDEDVRTIALSPDGKMIATNVSGGIELLDSRSGDRIKIIGTEESGVSSIAFSPDGTMIAGAMYGGVKLWDVGSGKLIYSFDKAQAPVLFSHDGKILACGSGDDYIRLFATETGDKIRTIEGAGEVKSLAFSRDGLYLASGGEKVNVWNTATGSKASTFKVDPKATSVATDKSGGWFAFGGNDVHLVDAQTGLEKGKFGDESSYDTVKLIAFSPDGKSAATVYGAENSSKLWNTTTGNEIREFSGYSIAVQSVAFSPDDKSLFSGGDKGAVIKWDIATGKIVKLIGNVDEPVVSIVLGPDAKTLLYSNDRSSYGFIDSINGTVKELDTTLDLSGTPVFSDDWKYVAVAGTTVTVLAYPGGDEINTLKPQFEEDVDIGTLAFSPIHPFLAGLIANHGISVWNTTTGKVVRSIQGVFGVLSTIEYSRDGRLIICGCVDGTNDSGDTAIKIWDANTGILRKTIANQSTDFALSPEGGLVATFEAGEGVNLYSTVSGLRVRPIRLGSGAVMLYGMKFSHNGKILAVATDEGVSLLDVATGKEIRVLA